MKLLIFQREKGENVAKCVFQLSADRCQRKTKRRNPAVTGPVVQTTKGKPAKVAKVAAKKGKGDAKGKTKEQPHLERSLNVERRNSYRLLFQIHQKYALLAFRWFLLICPRTFGAQSWLKKLEMLRQKVNFFGKTPLHGKHKIKVSNHKAQNQNTH